MVFGRLPFVWQYHSYPQLFQKQIKPTRGGTPVVPTVQKVLIFANSQKGLRHADCTKWLCKTLIAIMVQNMSKIAKRNQR